MGEHDGPHRRATPTPPGKVCMIASALTSSSVPYVPQAAMTTYIISTHAKCFDGAAAAALLELYCATNGLRHFNIPHVFGKSFLREFGWYLQQKRPVTILMFDVAPDEELVLTLMASEHVHLVCGDHHVGTKAMMDRLAALKSPRLSVRFDNAISGAQLAWEWIYHTLHGNMGTLGVVLDAACGGHSKLLLAISAFDLFLHKGNPEMEAIEASLRLLFVPDADTIKGLLTTPGKYDALVRDGSLCVRIRDNISRDLLQRGRVYTLNRRAVGIVRSHGTSIPEDCSVFYVQGIPHVSGEMAYIHASAETCADLIWIWSKIESAPTKRFTVSVRRGRPSDLRCDVVALALGHGNGHAGAAGMAFDVEPTFHFA